MEALSLPSRSHLLSTSPKIRKLKLKFNHKISYPPKPKPPIPLSRISNFAFIKCSAHSHNHSHDHRHNHPEAHDHHHHHHHGHHCHGHGGCDDTLTKSQQTFLRFAEAVKWSDLANFLREHLELCCCAAALFVAAGACPFDNFGEQYSRAVIILSVAIALMGPILFKWPFFSTAACACKSSSTARQSSKA